jgi:hypothetical protein
MFEQSSGEVAVVLIEFDHPDTPGSPPWPFRVCDHTIDVVSNGNTFIAGPIGVQLPDQDSQAETSVKLTVLGPPQVFIEELRKINNPPTFKVQIVLLSEPDTVLEEYDQIILRNVEADRISIVFELRYEQLSEEPYPGDRFNVPLFPGLF